MGANYHTTVVCSESQVDMISRIGVGVRVAVFAHVCACILPGSRLFGRFSRSVSSIGAGLP